MNPAITERQINVIKAIVDEYILTGNPVGSQIIVEAHIKDTSSATIRKEMSLLEQMGFLNSPHTSAGRVPTDYAIKLYIENLINLYEITLIQKTQLENFYKQAKLQIDQLLKRTATLLATISKNVAVVLSPICTVISIKRIELVSILDNLILLIMVTSTGTVFQKKIKLEASISQESLYKISRYINHKLVGYELAELQNQDLSFFHNDGESLSSELMEVALKIIQNLIYHPPEQDMYLDGEQNFYEQLLQNLPEKEEVDIVMNSITNKDFLKELLSASNNTNKVTTQVGITINNKLISGISILSKSYSVGGKNIGSLGIIGSTRMPYDKLIPAVDYSALLLSNALKEHAEYTHDDLSKLIP